LVLELIPKQVVILSKAKILASIIEILRFARKDRVCFLIVIKYLHLLEKNIKTMYA
jgi:hypothetical protein